MAAAELTTLFQRYGDESGQWSGGDRTASVALPDGRLLWLFSDTYLGPVRPDGSRPRTSPFVNNSAVLQDGGVLGPTIHGGPVAAPTALVPTGVAGEFYWVGDALVHDGGLQVLYNRYRRTGSGTLDFTLTGTALAALQLPDMRVGGVTPLPLGGRVAWGSALLADGGHTYVYGSEAAGEMKFAHVARVRGTDLAGRWEFWTGGGWSPSVAASARLISGVGTAFGVQKVSGGYVLATQENNLLFSPELVAYTAPAPTGPFQGPSYLHRAAETGAGLVVYDADLHPELARPGKLLLSYNVNHLDSDRVYADAGIYRPRFVDLDWPPRQADPAALPAAPTGLTATVASAGEVALAWRPPGGTGLTYRVHRRDVSAGQTHFVRLPDLASAPRFKADFLVNGHLYEFRVTAVNAAGESRPSQVATITAIVPPPPAPGGVRAEPGRSGEIQVSWTGHPLAHEHRVFYRDLTAGQRRRTLAGTFAGDGARVGPLRHGRVYEITVVAVGGGGASGPSPPVRVRAVVAPPGPVPGLTAEALRDGAVRVRWHSLGPLVSYFVYRRDLTTGQTRFTRQALPVIGALEFTTEPLVHGHEYEFRVTGLNDGGEGPLSGLVRVRAGHAPPGAAPSGLRAVPGPGTVELSWRPAVPDAWHWVYLRDLTAGQLDFVRSEVAVHGAVATMHALVGGHEYEFKVVQFNPGGEGPASLTARAVPGPAVR
jgi:hypothetical protein